MSLTITIPNKQSFIKDDINIVVTTTTTGVEAHYIIIDIDVDSTIITAKHPVIDGSAVFNVAELINSKSDEIFHLDSSIFTNSTNNISWRIRSSEIYDFEETLHHTTAYVNSNSYRGSAGIYTPTKFLTNYRQKIIHRTEFVLLFFNFDTLAFEPKELIITFNNDPQTILTETLSTGLCVQVFIRPEYIPETATQMIVQITGYSERIVFEISDFNVIDKETFVYRNSFGVYDTISLYAHKNIQDNFSFETFISDDKNQKYNALYQEETSKATYLLNSQFENEKEAAYAIRELFLSEEVYLIEERNQSKPTIYNTIPILITDSKRIIESTQEQMFTLEITYVKTLKNA